MGVDVEIPGREREDRERYFLLCFLAVTQPCSALIGWAEAACIRRVELDQTDGQSESRSAGRAAELRAAITDRAARFNKSASPAASHSPPEPNRICTYICF